MVAKKTVRYLEQHPRVILFFFCTLFFIHIMFAFCGFYGNDDINYSRYAATFWHHSYTARNCCDHFGLRWAPIFATAIFYEAFGVNAVSSALFSAISFLITALLIFRFMRHEKIEVQLLVWILFFWNYSVVFYSHRLLPDAGMCLFNFLAYYVYYRQLFDEKKKEIFHSFIFAASIMLAALTKETLFLIFPFWLILFFIDLFKRRNSLFWLLSAVFLLSFLFFYLLYFKLTTGDWFFRYHILQRDNSFGGDSYAHHPFVETFKRWSYQLWNAFLLNGDFEYLLFSICGLIYFKSIYKDERIKHIALSFLLLLLCSNFMSYSPTEYSPLWADTRHYLFLVPFAVIAGAFVLHAYLQKPVKYMLVFISFVIADVFLLISDIGDTRYVYLFITFLLAIRLLLEFTSQKTLPVSVFYVAFGLVMSLNFFYDFVRPQYPYYFEQKNIVQSFFEHPQNNAIIYAGDRETAEMGDYFLSFKNDRIRFENIDTCREFGHWEDAKYYLLMNGDYNRYLKQKSDSLFSDKNFASNFTELKRINHSVLYEVKDPQVLTILKPFSTNDY